MDKGIERWLRRAAVLLTLLAAGPAGAFWGWRDRLAAAWPAAPVRVDGTDAKWAGVDELAEPQLDLRGMNDETSVYLRLSARGLDGRALLTGAFRQDVTLWFMAAGGNSRAWGLRLPFSALEGPARPPRRDEPVRVPALEPLLALPRGAGAVTSPLPGDILVRSGLSGGEEPTFEIAIPLSRLNLVRGRTLPFDLESSPADPELRRRFRPKPARHGLRTEEVSLPAPLRLRLVLRLAEKPASR